MDNSQFFWRGSIFCFSPCPQFPGLDEFCLSLPRVQAAEFHSDDSQQLRLLTDCLSLEDKVKFEQGFKTWISLAFAVVGIS